MLESFLGAAAIVKLGTLDVLLIELYQSQLSCLSTVSTSEALALLVKPKPKTANPKVVTDKDFFIFTNFPTFLNF